MNKKPLDEKIKNKVWIHEHQDWRRTYKDLLEAKYVREAVKEFEKGMKFRFFKIRNRMKLTYASLKEEMLLDEIDVKLSEELRKHFGTLAEEVKNEYTTKIRKTKGSI